jgi:hypothetical protein
LAKNDPIATTRTKAAKGEIVADVLLNCAGARRRKILIVSLAVLRYCGLRGLLIGAICLNVRKFIFFCFPA